MMRAPATEWSAIVGAAVIVNVVRALGEADGDTLCESWLRPVIERVPAGRYVFAGGLAALYWHVVRPTAQPSARQRIVNDR